MSFLGIPALFIKKVLLLEDDHTLTLDALAMIHSGRYRATLQCCKWIIEGAEYQVLREFDGALLSNSGIIASIEVSSRDSSMNQASLTCGPIFKRPAKSSLLVFTCDPKQLLRHSCACLEIRGHGIHVPQKDASLPRLSSSFHPLI